MSPKVSRFGSISVIFRVGLFFSLILFLPIVGKAITIDADSQLDYAEHLLFEGKYEPAITEFNRFSYFFPEDPRAERAILEEGFCYYRMNRFQEANAVFKQLITGGCKTYTLHRAYLMMAGCAYHAGDTQGAVTTLEQLVQIADEPTITDDAWYVFGWLMIENAEWDKAALAFHRIGPEGCRLFRCDNLISALSAVDTLPERNPNMAGILSILPGAGHLYCDRPQDAVIALLLNTALTISAWQAFDRNIPWLGGLLSVAEISVYSGTIYSAINCAHKYNRDQRNRFTEKLKQQNAPVISIAPVPGGFHLSLKVDF